MESARQSEGDSMPLSVASMNCRGQTKLSETKQQMIQHEIKMRKIDILHMQECRVTSETFQKCDFIKAKCESVADFVPKIGDFYVKPVKISGFSMLAHACSCVLTYSLLSLNRVSR